MTERIHIMDESLSSKIAAGEVVERPASIVKELVENALDAGATKITIALEDGGKSSITITDNGSGIEAEDVPLTVHRHATSKLHNEAELEAISTMGFRGEALYSIAAVSKFSLKSKTEGAVGGKKVSVSGGGVAKITDDPCNVGTTVEVKELFFNTPARQKFLRGAQTEFTRIMELIRKMAIARPDVRFTLKHGKRSSFDVPEAELKKRLGDIFGDDVTGELLEVKGNPGWDVSVTGYVSTAGRGQATAKNVMTFLNGRIIKDKAINRAIIDGYQGMIDGGRYPFAVIMIEMNAGEVDVNVHPAKTEVRFAKPSAIFNAVKGSVTNALRGGNGAKSIRYTEARRPFGNATEVKAAEETTRVPFKPSAPPRTAFGKATFGGDKVMPPELRAEQQEMIEEVVSDDIREPLFLSMDVVGQLFGEFLVTTRGTEFFLIDQHAAAERVRYEKLKELYKGNSGGAESMLLLMPQSFTLSGEEGENMKELTKRLSALGFEIELKEVSDDKVSCKVKAVPGILEGRDVARLLKELVEEFTFSGSSAAIEEAIDAVLMRIACHSVIRGVSRLAPEGARALLNSLARVDFSNNCPHGRPVVKSFTRSELDSFFGR